MLNLALVYVISIFIVLRFSVTLFNFLSNPKLGKYGRHFNDKITIIIDGTKSTSGLLQLLHSLRHQDYRYIEVMIEQPAQTALSAELNALYAEDHRFTCSQTINPAQDSTGTYILFLGTNTLIYNGLLNSLIYRARVFNLALLSVIPTQFYKGFINHCLVPLNNFLLLNLTPLRLVRMFSSPVFSAGSNQCMFFDAAIYRQYNWEQRFKGKMPDALEVVRAVKEENYKAETLLGNKLICATVAAHPNRPLQQTGLLLLRKFGNSILAAFFYLLLVVVGPLFMLANAEYSLLILPVGLIFMSRVMISFLSGQNPIWNVLLHPIQMLMLLLSLSLAIYRKGIGLLGAKN